MVSVKQEWITIENRATFGKAKTAVVFVTFLGGQDLQTVYEILHAKSLHHA